MIAVTNVYSNIIKCPSEERLHHQLSSADSKCTHTVEVSGITTIKSRFRTLFAESSSYILLITPQLSKYSHGKGEWGHWRGIWHEHGRPVDVSSDKLPWHDLTGASQAAQPSYARCSHLYHFLNTENSCRCLHRGFFSIYFRYPSVKS